MKNRFYLSLILAIAASVIVSCSSKKVEAPVDDFIDTLGVLTAFSDATYDDENGRHIQRRAYPNLSSLLSDLKSGNLDYAQLPHTVIDYINSKDDSFVTIDLDNEIEYYSIGIAPRNKDLLDEINEAIGYLNSAEAKPGLKDLRNYFDKDESSYEQIEFETFEGAPTITFAVTGNLPPIDYVNDQGEPSGFGVAFLAEIGKRLKKNIKIIKCDPSERPAVLISRKADALLWVTSILHSDYAPESFTMEGILSSEPYLQVNMEKIALKK